jgi:hypothetical protein
MAHKRSRTAGKHGSELARSGWGDWVANEVHAAIEPMQQTACSTTGDRTPADSRELELADGGQRQLATRHPSDRRITAPVLMHKAPKLARRDHIGYISVWEMLM